MEGVDALRRSRSRECAAIRDVRHSEKPSDRPQARSRVLPGASAENDSDPSERSRREQSDRIMIGIVGAEMWETDQLGELVGWCARYSRRAHLREANLVSPIRQLPGASEPASPRR